jgi:hypothetical protein
MEANKSCPWCGEEPTPKGTTHVQCATYGCPGGRILFTKEEWNTRAKPIKTRDGYIVHDANAELTEMPMPDYCRVTLNDKTDFWLDDTGKYSQIQGHSGKLRMELGNFRLFRLNNAIVPILKDMLKETQRKLDAATESIMRLQEIKK